MIERPTLNMLTEKKETQVMARSSYSASKFSRLVNVEGVEGDFYLIRKATKNARVIPVNDLTGSGTIVEVSKLLNERDIPAPVVPPEVPAVAPVAQPEVPAQVNTEVVEAPVAVITATAEGSVVITPVIAETVETTLTEAAPAQELVTA